MVALGLRPLPHHRGMNCPDSISLDIFMVGPSLPPLFFCLLVCSFEISSHCVAQVYLQLRMPPAPVSHVLGSQSYVPSVIGHCSYKG